MKPNVSHCHSQSLSLGRRGAGAAGASSSATGSSASGGAGGAGGRQLSFGNPLFDLAMPKDEVKARLAPIPVYTVANPKNEFVLVAGEVRLRRGRWSLIQPLAAGVDSAVRLRLSAGSGCGWAAACVLPVKSTPRPRARRAIVAGAAAGAAPPLTARFSPHPLPAGQHAAGILLFPEGGRGGHHRQGAAPAGRLGADVSLAEAAMSPSGVCA